MKNAINTEICTKDKLCYEVCPVKIIDINSEGNLFFIPEKIDLCFECGQCMAICTTKAVSINGIEYGKEIIDLSENKVDYNEFIHFLMHRRSVRNFKNEPVPDEVLEKIVDSVSYAPFGASPEKMHVTIVNNRETIEKSLPEIEKFLDNIVKWVENPFMSRMIKFKKGIETFQTIKNHLYPMAKIGHYKLANGDRITRNAPSILIFHAENDAEEHTHNALIYATYVMLSAEAAGYGASMIEIVPSAINRVKKLKEIFKIPDSHEAVMSLIVGKSKYKFRRAVKHSALKVHKI
jgi:nitroreductase/NAD-dependent dihydropyrimidine dehydrogenase PreA subunit